MTRRSAIAIILAAVVLLAAAVLAQHIRKGSVAVIRSDDMQVDWGTGLTEMTGNVRVDIKGDYTATMTASSVIVKADLEKAQVLSLEARGPVRFDIDTAPVEGKRSHITASCTQQAVFSEQTMVVTLEGNAHAEITGATAVVGQVEAAKYDGETVSIDLNKRSIRLKQATAEIHMAPEATKTEAAPGNP